MWSIYRHYKGGHYLGLATALHSETLEPLQIYRTLYDNEVARTWARPQAMFDTRTEHGVPRFDFVGSVRRAFEHEMTELLSFGYDELGKGLSFGDFTASYGYATHPYCGTWYVFERADGALCAHMHTLHFRQRLVGLAAISTRQAERGKGYASLLVRAVMEVLRLEQPDTRFILFSANFTSMLERLGFRVLPGELQHCKPLLAMSTGDCLLSPDERPFVESSF
jgi:hypothetical protein